MMNKDKRDWPQPKPPPYPADDEDAPCVGITGHAWRRTPDGAICLRCGTRIYYQEHDRV